MNSDRPPHFFRPAKSEDAQTIKDIARRVIVSDYTPFLGAGAVRDFIESGLADKEIDDGMEHCTLMVCDDRILGFAITDGPLLHLIMIDAACQNSGFGSKLLAYVEGLLFEAYETIRLQTFRENTQAVRFYLKHGWNVVEENVVPEMGKTMLSFEKTGHGKAVR